MAGCRFQSQIDIVIAIEKIIFAQSLQFPKIE